MKAYELHTLYESWVRAEQSRDILRAQQTKGVLRGGSSGALGKTGQVYGTCPRAALARSWGWNDPIPPSRKLMIEGGKGSETLWEARLTDMLGDKAQGEGAVKIQWKTSTGMEVLGTPDATIKNDDGTLTGLEHKRVSSAWTARTVSVKRKPKAKHFVQACHYMIAGGYSNYILLYTQDVDFPCPGVAGMDSRVLWPEMYSIIEYKNGYPFRIEPHISAFDISLSADGVFWFKHHAEAEWTMSEVTAEGIKGYYELVCRQMTDEVLASKPTLSSPVGDSKANQSDCVTCSLASVCENKALRYSEFKDQITERIKSSVL
jgi:hypothetical protein